MYFVRVVSACEYCVLVDSRFGAEDQSIARKVAITETKIQFSETAGVYLRNSTTKTPMESDENDYSTATQVPAYALRMAFSTNSQ